MSLFTSTLRKNVCYPVLVTQYASPGGPPSVAPTNIAVELQSNSAGRFYGTEVGCQQQDSGDERSNFFIAAGESSVTAYLRALDVGQLNFTAQSTSASQGNIVIQKKLPVAFSSFNPAQGPDYSVTLVALDPGNEKLYVSGYFLNWNDLPRKYLVRLNNDGSLDTGFSLAGSGLDAKVEAISVQSDGRVLIGGDFTSYNGTPCPHLARLNTDGSLDTSFAQAGSGLSDAVASIAVQNDGRIVVGGWFTAYNGTARARVARLNADGSLDGTFTQTGTGLNTWQPNAKLVLQSDGKILVSGNWNTTYNGTARPGILRLNTNGSLDGTFAQTGTGLDSAVRAIALQSDGSVVVAGDFTTYNGTARRYIARLNSNGSLDSSFAHTGTGLDSWVGSLALQSDGRILLSGGFTNYNGTARSRVARLNSDGSLHTSFALVGSGFDGPVGNLALQSDGRIFIGGSFIKYNNTARPRIARLNTDGSLDTDVAPTAWGLDDEVFTIALSKDGRFMVGGRFTSFNGVSRPRIARLDSDGSLDTSFVTTGSGLDDFVYAIALQDDGRAIVGGRFSNYNGASRPKLVRLNNDGSLDPGFVLAGTALNGNVKSIALQSDGRILVGGGFSNYNGSSRPNVARLNSDGSLDNSFTPTGTGLNNWVESIAVQSDGRLVVAGSFTSYNGTARTGVARLNSDGSLDTSFALSGSGFDDDVSSIALQADGRVVVVGSFTEYNGTARPGIARLNNDGSLDTSFAPTPRGSDDFALSVVIQNDGRILAGGFFIDWNVYPYTVYPYIMRLNTDGSLDTSFASLGSTDTNDYVNSIVVQKDGRILVGGWWNAYGTTTAPMLMRLTPRGALD